MYEIILEWSSAVPERLTGKGVCGNVFFLFMVSLTTHSVVQTMERHTNEWQVNDKLER
jgi:hypothetical protein